MGLPNIDLAALGIPPLANDNKTQNTQQHNTVPSSNFNPNAAAVNQLPMAMPDLNALAGLDPNLLSQLKMPPAMGAGGLPGNIDLLTNPLQGLGLPNLGMP